MSEKITKVSDLIHSLETIHKIYGDIRITSDKYVGFGDAWHYEGPTSDIDVMVIGPAPVCHIKGV